MYPSIGSSRSKRARGLCRENSQRSQARNESHQSGYGKTKVMNLPRRRFLGSSLLVFGSTLMDALTTPLWRWRRSLVLQLTVGSTQPAPVQFVDVAHEAGLNVPNVWGATDHKSYIIEAKGSGIAFFDYDHDGWLDIYLTNGTRLGEKWPEGKAPTSQLFKNNRDGTFTNVTEKSGLARTGWQTGVCVGDCDNDGWDDLFCCFWGHNILFHNNGDGSFTDITRKAGVYDDRIRWGAGCTFLDNDGDGTFTDVSEKAGILKPGPRYSITAVSYDFDSDGWPDIYVAVDSQPSILFRNNHDGTFTDIAVMAGCAYSEDGHEQAGMGVAVGDYDCDGWLDMFKTNFADDTCNLYHNNGDGTFSDTTFASGIAVNTRYVGWGCGFIDYDNDGWLDILQINGHVYPEIDKNDVGQTYKNPRLIYRNMGNGKFKDVSAAMGPGITERLSSRGAAFGDYDNDGDVDVLVLNMNDVPSLLRNDGGNKQNWIKVKLIGTKCNRTAIGARVRVVTGDHAQIDEVHSGSSVMSQGDLRLHFGLGRAQAVDLIEVKWPTTQKIERFTQVKANQIFTIREGSGIVEQRPSQ